MGAAKRIMQLVIMKLNIKEHTILKILNWYFTIFYSLWKTFTCLLLYPFIYLTEFFSSKMKTNHLASGHNHISNNLIHFRQHQSYQES